MLKREELKRYSRQMILPGLGLQGQEKLKTARVLMIGAGGLGCPVLQYLAAAGVGSIGIVDDDVVDISNLHRQILYTAEDAGQPKALIAQRKLAQLNPFAELTAYNERITAANAQQLIAPFDVVMDGSDNFKTRYLVNDVCRALNKPLVFGSIFKFEGQVSVFNHRGGPNYRDIFPEAPPEKEVPNCAETGVIGVLPGMVGSYMANEAIKLICGIGEILRGQLLTINALDNSVRIFRFGKIPGSSYLQRNQDIIQPDKAPEKKSSTPMEVDLLTLNTWRRDEPGAICLIDVREAYEFEDFNIGGINIPLAELAERLSELPADKTKIVFCCQSGQRSKQAAFLTGPLLPAQVFSLESGIYNV